MKVLLVTRLFSGFHESVRQGVWKPTGAPAIYKLIEALNASRHELTLIFTWKEEVAGLDTAQDRQIELDGLDGQIDLLAGEARFPTLLGRLRWYAFEIRQTFRVWRMVHKQQPDLVYVDRGNLMIASALARFSAFRVVYRIMGISPSIKDAFNFVGPRHFLTRWQLRAPFELVVCSLDGSGGAYWLDRVLRPDVSRRLLLNGVDVAAAPEPSQASSTCDTSQTRILFVGRLEPIKGCDEFIAATLIALEQEPDGLEFIIVGSGSQEQTLKSKVKEAGVERRYRFLGALPHDQVVEQYRHCEIFVSMNLMGNLSNVNLEAMRSGCCIVIPDIRDEYGVDADIADIFPDGSIVRVRDIHDHDNLARALLQLHREPDDRRSRAMVIEQASMKYIPSWQERIEHEIGLLETAAHSTSDPDHQ